MRQLREGLKRLSYPDVVKGVAGSRLLGVSKDYHPVQKINTPISFSRTRFLIGSEQKVAADFRDGVAGHMTPAQLAEAERLAQQCQAQGFKGC